MGMLVPAGHWAMNCPDAENFWKWPALPLRDFRVQCEREYVEAVLRRTDWNFAAAARLLGIQRTYLHQKVAALGLERPARGADRSEEG